MRVRTAKGEVLDMTALMGNNSDTVALGNANMNARGDIVNRSGEVLKSREVVVQEYYAANPRAVSKSVSLRDLGSEALTPNEVIEKLEGKKKPASKRKLIDVEDEDEG